MVSQAERTLIGKVMDMGLGRSGCRPVSCIVEAFHNVDYNFTQSMRLEFNFELCNEKSFRFYGAPKN
jgi:hypothetical protein